MILPISVIIPTMNRPKRLDRTLEYISKSVDIPHQIIIVDQSNNTDAQEQNKEVLAKYDMFTSRIYEYQQIPRQNIHIYGKSCCIL